LVTRLPQKHSRPGARRTHGLTRRFGLDRRRAVLVCCLLAGVIGLAAVGGTMVATTRPASAPGQGRGAELATGPIVFVPRSGNDCRERVIDNDTWRIRDNGTVDCDTALGTRSDTPPREGTPSRTDIIRKGFRGN
jgi:hypothetical protein